MAAALAQRRRHTLLAFHSPRCRLCAALRPNLEKSASASLGVVMLDAEQPSVMPEVR